MPGEQVHDLGLGQATADRAADDRKRGLVALAFLNVRQDTGSGTMEAVSGISRFSRTSGPSSAVERSGRPRRLAKPEAGGRGPMIRTASTMKLFIWPAVMAGIAGSSGRMVSGEAGPTHSTAGRSCACHRPRTARRRRRAGRACRAPGPDRARHGLPINAQRRPLLLPRRASGVDVQLTSASASSRAAWSGVPSTSGQRPAGPA